MKRDTLVDELFNLYGKFIEYQDSTNEKMDKLTNEIAELEWKWEELCKSKGLKVIKE